MLKNEIIPVILSGGQGTRLWPISRASYPKQLMPFIDNKSLLQKTFERLRSLSGVSKIITVTNRDFLFQTQDGYRKLNAENNDLDLFYILEPFGKNTAAAITATALFLENRFGSEAIMLVCPSDHLISDKKAFSEDVDKAISLAHEKKLVTFGIKPTAPETGYGYIEIDGNCVRQFVEKPDLITAKKYIDSGNFLWNSGMFCFKISFFLEEMEIHNPEMVQAVRNCLRVSENDSNKLTKILELDSHEFEKIENTSIDYTLMEKSESVSVINSSFGWSDIGSWKSLHSAMDQDKMGNYFTGDVITHDTLNCHVQSDNRLVATVGLRNLTIIDTPDALLVCNQDSSQDVKYIVDELNRKGNNVTQLHRKVNRPWGTYVVLEEGDYFKVKQIEVNPGASLSLQLHHHRNEHWVVVKGVAKIINDEKEFLLNENESTYIPANHKHRLENPGLIPLIVIEVQSGNYLGEDDIIRYEDVYGRADLKINNVVVGETAQK